MPNPISAAPTRTLRVIAQDPSVRVNGKILCSELEIVAEPLEPGPCGHRISVIDYDSTTDTLYRPLLCEPGVDPFADANDSDLLEDPRFHAQNAYAIVMRTLSRFEYALGRRVGWSFEGHQLKIAPHAFADANAFYSRRDESLLFGYFPSQTSDAIVFSSLSHDVVAHETTHALLDGMRRRYIYPSSPDQAAFHEGFCDVVALLSVLAQQPVVEAVLPRTRGDHSGAVRMKDIEPAALRSSALLGLAEQMGSELQGVRGGALRRSAELEPSARYLEADEFQLPHRRGEILTAAMLNAYLEIVAKRLTDLGTIAPGQINRRRVVEELAEQAERLLSVAIRAIDYCPPVDLQFCDYLSALLTVDLELFPNDSKYAFFRELIVQSFADYGIEPDSRARADGTWQPAKDGLRYDRNHFEPLRYDADEVFRFIWENRAALELFGHGNPGAAAGADPGADPDAVLSARSGAHCRVLSVRPSVRQGPDGFFLRETVSEYLEVLKLRAHELGLCGLEKPAGMADDQIVSLYGGGTLIFDEFGRLKFHIKNNIDSSRQQGRLDYLWNHGFFDPAGPRQLRLSEIHLRRAGASLPQSSEGW